MVGRGVNPRTYRFFGESLCSGTLNQHDSDAVQLSACFGCPLVNEGAHLLAVKERLGHSTIRVTADRYGHLFPSLEVALTAKLDASYRDATAAFRVKAIERV